MVGFLISLGLLRLTRAILQPVRIHFYPYWFILWPLYLGWDLREHSEEGLEARPGDKAHPADGQVSADRPQPGVRPQRGGRQTSTRNRLHREELGTLCVLYVYTVHYLRYKEFGFWAQYKKKTKIASRLF